MFMHINEREHDQEKVNDLELITWCLRRSRNQMMWMTAIATLFTLAALGVVMWTPIDAPANVLTWATIIAATTGFLALWGGVWLAFNGRVESSHLVQALRAHPQQALWVYGGSLSYYVNGMRLPNPDNSIHFALANGSVQSVRNIPADQLRNVQAAAVRLTPFAVYGFTRDNERRYKDALSR